MDEMSPLAKALLSDARDFNSPSDEQLGRLQRRLEASEARGVGGHDPSASLLAELHEVEARGRGPLARRLVAVTAVAAALLLSAMAIGSAFLGQPRGGATSGSLALMRSVTAASTASSSVAGAASDAAPSPGATAGAAEVAHADEEGNDEAEGEDDEKAEVEERSDDDLSGTTGGLKVDAARAERRASTRRRKAASPAFEDRSDSTDDLALQAALVGQARRKLAQGAWLDVRRLVVEYQERFAGGVFVEEVKVMRMIADCEVDRSTYGGVASRYLDAHPRSMFAESLRSSCLDPSR